jgi:hypothetical protein
MPIAKTIVANIENVLTFTLIILPFLYRKLLLFYSYPFIIDVRNPLKLPTDEEVYEKM